MPENNATLPGEDGKRVTITIAELTEGNPAGTTADPGEDPNTFVIQNGKYQLTITIAE